MSNNNAIDAPFLIKKILAEIEEFNRNSEIPKLWKIESSLKDAIAAIKNEKDAQLLQELILKEIDEILDKILLLPSELYNAYQAIAEFRLRQEYKKNQLI
ncbi:MAG: hypothetical protein EBS06_05350 [Proteobacteria bacterium]|nr:hypothetical protein [Pseudomonadota bacterium]